MHLTYLLSDGGLSLLLDPEGHKARDISIGPGHRTVPDTWEGFGQYNYAIILTTSLRSKRLPWDLGTPQR